HIGAGILGLAAAPGLAVIGDRALDKIADLRVLLAPRRNLGAGRQPRQANARAAEHAEALVLDTRKLAVADPGMALRAHHDRLLEPPLREFELLAGQIFRAGGVAILVDLMPVGHDLRIDAFLESAAFGFERFPRIAQIDMRQIGQARQALELQPQADGRLFLHLRPVIDALGIEAAFARHQEPVLDHAPAFERIAILVEGVAMARCAVAGAVGIPREFELHAGHAGIEWKLLGGEAAFAADAALDKLDLGNAHDGNAGLHRFLPCSRAARRHGLMPHAPAPTGRAHRTRILAHLPPLAAG